MSQQEALTLIQYLKENPNLRNVGGKDDYFGITKNKIESHQIRSLLTKVEIHCISHIAMMSGDIVYPEMTLIAEWPIGGFQDPHLDRFAGHEVKNVEEEKWAELNIKPHREWTCICNLNSNYNDGRTFFPEHPDYPEHEPETGTGLIFKGIDVMHGVTPVRRNSRFTVALWFTQDFDRAYYESTAH